MSEGIKDTTEDLIRRRGLDFTNGDTEFVADMVRRYREADEASRADIRAFFESDGPDMVKDAAVEPTQRAGEEAEEELSVQSYMGNSVQHWYAKAKAYGDMVHGVNPILEAKDGEATKDAARRVVAELAEAKEMQRLALKAHADEERLYNRTQGELEKVEEDLETAQAGATRLRGFLEQVAPQPFVCPECGPFVASDEDSCCASCGRDVVIVPLDKVLTSVVETFVMHADGCRLKPGHEPPCQKERLDLKPANEYAAEVAGFSRCPLGGCREENPKKCLLCHVTFIVERVRTEVQETVDCPECDGYVADPLAFSDDPHKETPCPKCGGTGKVVKEAGDAS